MVRLRKTNAKPRGALDLSVLSILISGCTQLAEDAASRLQTSEKDSCSTFFRFARLIISHRVSVGQAKKVAGKSDESGQESRRVRPSAK
jgi:hypothetical protein